MAQAPQADERDIAEVLAQLDEQPVMPAPQADNQPAVGPVAANENNMAQAPVAGDQPVSYLDSPFLKFLRFIFSLGHFTNFVCCLFRSIISATHQWVPILVPEGKSFSFDSNNTCKTRLLG